VGNIKGLLFDLDGVLVSTEHNHFEAWKKTADKLGIAFNETDNEQLKGVSRVHSLEKILAMGGIKLSEVEFNDLLVFKNDCYLESVRFLNPSNLLPGVANLLKKAKQYGLSIGLGSSSKNAPLILELLQITSYFDVVMDGNNTSSPKPSPDVFLSGAQQLGLKPFECLVFEDAQSGVEAGKSGGFRVIGVGNSAIKDLCDEFVTSLEHFQLENYAKPV
jgi:beta-phosphoglucomutase